MTRLRSRSRLARPYICRLIALSRFDVAFGRPGTVGQAQPGGDSGQVLADPGGEGVQFGLVVGVGALKPAGQFLFSGAGQAASRVITVAATVGGVRDWLAVFAEPRQGAARWPAVSRPGLRRRCLPVRHSQANPGTMRRIRRRWLVLSRPRSWSWSPPVQPCLPHDASLGTRWQFGAWLASYCHPPRLERVLGLPVTSHGELSDIVAGLSRTALRFCGPVWLASPQRLVAAPWPG